MIQEQAPKNEGMVEENIGLVHLCAKRFVGRGMEYDDLFQAGCVGLIKAANHFDAARGFQFSTYAVPVILGEIKGLFRTGNAVKISRSLRELSVRAKQEAEKIQEETGRSAGIAEIAQRLEISMEKAALVLGALKGPISLSGEDGQEEIQIADVQQVEAVTDRITVDQLLAQLEEADRLLLIYRYFQRKTQQETAEKLHMTQVQVSRREKKLLALLREML